MKTRNEILKDDENDRFIFIQYNEKVFDHNGNNRVEWLNFHQGIDDFDDSYNEPNDRLTDIFNNLVRFEDSDGEDCLEFRTNLTKAIELYTRAFIFPELGLGDETAKLDTYKATVKFFQSLISRTNTYFLSDYVESELDGYIDDKEEYDGIILQLKQLCGECSKYGLDMHQISQEVASPFVESMGGDTDHPLPKKKNDNIKQVIPQGQVAHIQRALNLLESALENTPQEQKDRNSDIDYTLFDITTLRGLLKSEVSISISREDMESFCHNHGVDFPNYIV